MSKYDPQVPLSIGPELLLHGSLDLHEATSQRTDRQTDHVQW